MKTPTVAQFIQYGVILVLIITCIALYFSRKTIPVPPPVDVTKSPEYLRQGEIKDSALHRLNVLEKDFLFRQVTIDSLSNEINQFKGKHSKRDNFYEALRDSIAQYDSTDVDRYFTNRGKVN